MLPFLVRNDSLRPHFFKGGKVWTIISIRYSLCQLTQVLTLMKNIATILTHMLIWWWSVCMPTYWTIQVALLKWAPSRLPTAIWKCPYCWRNNSVRLSLSWGNIPTGMSHCPVRHFDDAKFDSAFYIERNIYNREQCPQETEPRPGWYYPFYMVSGFRILYCFVPSRHIFLIINSQANERRACFYWR